MARIQSQHHPSAHPPNDPMDVFDGYLFKGRNSILFDDEDVSEDGLEAVLTLCQQ